MNEQELIGREMPYTLPSESLDRLRERILDQTVRKGPAHTLRPLGRLCIAGAASLLLAGAVLGACLLRRSAPAPDLDALLRSASAETLQQAAALNYDDILYNQQI